MNTLGKEVQLIVSEKNGPGKMQIKVDLKQYPSGIYFMKLDAGKQPVVQMFLLL